MRLRSASAAAALAALLARCAGSNDSEAPSRSRFLEVDGKRVFLRCTGEGTPAVVLEAGAGRDSSDWNAVQAEVSGFARVCSYDRAGLGRSGGEEGGDEDVVAELHALVRKAGVKGPFVLAGHSLGGFYVRLYEETYPEDVARMVLVDSVGGGESSLGAKPLVVLMQDGRDFRYDEWAHDQKRLAQLSGNTALVIGKGSDHEIPRRRPKLVAEAIRQVVEAARTDAKLRPCEEVFPPVGGKCVPLEP